MTIEIVCVGKLKEAFWKDAADEYIKRLRRFCKIIITELPERSPVGNTRAFEIKEAIAAESRDILHHVKRNASSYVIALDVKGKGMSSEVFSEKLSELAVLGKSHVIFIIGGPYGLSRELLSVVDFRLSFSKMTFPHRLMRVMLLEQVYRAFKIKGGETYHK